MSVCYFSKITEKIFKVNGVFDIGLIASPRVVLALRGQNCCIKRQILHILKKRLYIYNATMLFLTKILLCILYHILKTLLKRLQRGESDG